MKAARPPRVLVTRPEAQAQSTLELLAHAGLEGVSVPTVEIRTLDDLAPLDAVLASLDTCDDAVFAGATAAHIVGERLRALGLRWPTDLRTVAGPATASLLETYGVNPVLVVSPFSAAAAVGALIALAAAAASGTLAGRRIFLPCGSAAREELAHGLRAAGARVDQVVIYATMPVCQQPALVAAVRERQAAAIAFFSPSAVDGCMAALRSAGILPSEAAALFDGLTVACIGDTTAGAARAAGWQVDVIPDTTTTKAMVDKLAALLNRRRADTRHGSIEMETDPHGGFGLDGGRSTVREQCVA